MKINRDTTQINRRRIILLIAAVLSCAVLAVCIILYIRGRNTGDPTSQQPSNSSTSSSSSSTSSTTNSSGPSTNSSETNTTPPVDASVTPATPAGVFVSNHHRNLSGANSITSTCSTTPGASCTIRFTQGAVTKSLPSQIAGADGNMSWTWTLQEVGLTTGEWSVTAVATNGTKTSSADDALKLVVAE